MCPNVDLTKYPVKTPPVPMYQIQVAATSGSYRNKAHDPGASYGRATAFGFF